MPGLDHTVITLPTLVPRARSRARFDTVPRWPCPGILFRGTGIELDDPDMAWPAMIVEYLPVGLRGLVVAALLAALMSPLDSVLNGAPSLVVNDFIKTRDRQLSERQLLLLGRGLVASRLAPRDPGARRQALVRQLPRPVGAHLRAHRRLGRAVHLGGSSPSCPRSPTASSAASTSATTHATSCGWPPGSPARWTRSCTCSMSASPAPRSRAVRCPPAQRETGQHEAETLLAPLAEEADAKGVEVAHRLLGTPTSGAGRRSPGSVLVVREPAGEPGDRL